MQSIFRLEFCSAGKIGTDKFSRSSSFHAHQQIQNPPLMTRRLLDARRSSRRRCSYTSIFLLAAVVLFIYVVFYVPKHHPLNRGIKIHGNGANQVDRFTTTESGASYVLSTEGLLRHIGDQMTLAKAYVVIAKENSNFVLAWELSAQIRASQVLLSQAATTGEFPAKEAEPVMRELSALILQAKDLHYDSATMIMKLKAQIQSAEERTNAATAQSTIFGQLAAEAIPKGLHCLGMRLTTLWAGDTALQAKVESQRQSDRLTDNRLNHFCVFSDNVLAASVVVNSTVENSDRPDQLVFHLVTDSLNFGAMQTWFASAIDLKEATVEVQNVDDFTWLNSSWVPVMKQLEDAETQSYYFKSGSADVKDALKFRNPKYLSMLNHLRFYIPDVYPKLAKVVFLDDDVVVQKDLRALFSIDLEGNVNAAVETCLESFHRFHKYLNFSDPRISSNFDPESCGWAFGMNIFDLVAWRDKNVTSKYHYWQEQNVDRSLWKLGTLPPGLLTFYGLTYPLEPQWHVLGLGYDPNVDNRQIETGAVLHYNGNMKPWLKLAMSRYKPRWDKYVDFSHQHLQQCNVH